MDAPPPAGPALATAPPAGHPLEATADPRGFLEDLARTIGPGRLSTRLPDRDAYSRDLWPRAQLERLGGEPPTRPLAVVWPTDPGEVSAVVRCCAEAGVPIVPFGAGSGVCGGARPDRGGVVVDMKLQKRVRRIDAEALEVEVEAGVIGERFERILESRGLTLGHFPSSIVCSTVGGWLAGRSAGQCSSRYGKIEDMVVDLEVVTGDGVLRRTPRFDDLAGGPDWNQIFVGSEGTLGLITAATLRVHPHPAHRCFRGYRLPRIEAGFDVMREVMQLGHRPAVLRLYDALDTLMVGHRPDAGEGGAPGGRLRAWLERAEKELDLKSRATRTALGWPRALNAAINALPAGSLLVTVTEGEAGEATEVDEAIRRIAAARGGVDLGEGPGRRWIAHRHDVSYKQSRIYESGCFVDTFEVATTWAKLRGLYDAVRRAVAPHVMVMAHMSHAYPGGCSIYFTFAGAGGAAPELLRRYDRAWKAALDVALAEGATIAHHHGAGLSRRQHLGAAHGEARRWFDALKTTLDPAGILNPGKLFAEVA